MHILVKQRSTILGALQRLPHTIILENLFRRPKRRIVLDPVPILLEQFLVMRTQTRDFFLSGCFSVGDEIGNVLGPARVSTARETMRESANARARARGEAHLLPHGFPLRERLERLVQRIDDNLSNRHVPRPRLVHTKFLEQIHKRLFGFNGVGDPAGGHDRFRAKRGERVGEGFDTGEGGRRGTVALLGLGGEGRVVSRECLRRVVFAVCDAFDVARCMGHSSGQRFEEEEARAGERKRARTGRHQILRRPRRVAWLPLRPPRRSASTL